VTPGNRFGKNVKTLVSVASAKESAKLLTTLFILLKREKLVIVTLNLTSIFLYLKRARKERMKD
jgi:hypothetical protein